MQDWETLGLDTLPVGTSYRWWERKREGEKGGEEEEQREGGRMREMCMCVWPDLIYPFPHSVNEV